MPRLGIPRDGNCLSLVGLHGGRCCWDPNRNLHCMGSKKKSRQDSASSTELDRVARYVRFLIISSCDKEKGLCLSSFAVQKELKSIGDDPKTVKKLKSGDLLIETFSAIQTKSFLLAKTLANIPITVEPHRRLNSCRGVISEIQLHLKMKSLKESVAIFGTHKPLYGGSSIHVTVNCEPHAMHQRVEVQWVLRQTSCYEDYLASDIYTQDILRQYFICPMSTNSFPKIRFFISKPVILECSNRIHLEYVNASFVTFSDKMEIPPECENSIYTPAPTVWMEKAKNIENSISPKVPVMEKNATNVPIVTDENNVPANAGAQNRSKRSADPQDSISTKVNFAHINNKNESLSDQNSLGHLYGPFSSASNVKLGSKLTSVDMDGIYLFILKVESVDKKIFNVSVDIAMKGDYGYLSAVDYPLLIFYGVMCGLYVIYAIVWLISSALQWRDLLRIQFWIGAVILLGLMEKAVFYAEYQSINFTGQSVQGAILFAEILSCMKRTLARMLIIIVSLGFGIVKPRLGPTLHRIVGVGALYFGFGTIEGCLRVLKPKTDPGNQALMAGVPLAVTDSVSEDYAFLLSAH
ncbi:Transmembrane protein 87A [Araneus ventricosus]|uniref:Transmembrane protein 87A n=1 Tax=Araneus ventricosus TaxID=182803 RepID=A0A4Y2E034_ARAVE|nr:Transmembrane protein 87A [Araneus ventricosus]